MSGASITGPRGGAISQGSRRLVARGFAAWLALAAAPTFTVMALLTAIFGGGVGMCSTVKPSPLTGMALMYLLMAVFHAPPWLKLISSRSWAGAVRSRRR